MKERAGPSRKERVVTFCERAIESVTSEPMPLFVASFTYLTPNRLGLIEFTTKILIYAVCGTEMESNFRRTKVRG